MSGYKIAFDPSIRKIGWCTFDENGPCNNGVWYRPAKIKGLQNGLSWVWDIVDSELFMGHREEIIAVAIEAFNEHSTHPTGSLLKLAAAQGVIYAIARAHTKNVILVNKGKAKKEQAQQLARKAGLKDTEDAADAYYIGLLAGFGE
jgi:hypothetical protein